CRTGSPRAFFGCVYMTVTKEGAVTSSVAGHPPALRIGPDGAVRARIGTGAYPLGIKADLTWPVESSRLEPGELLLIHSDGLSEARSLAGEEFGDARIEAAARAGARLPAQALADELAGEARAFRAGEAPEDDVSIAVLRRTG
ncbi:MAG: PP2C family protein-serine/threonine phosphatase, partial [Syntrophomonadaceae bacterium]